MLNVFGEQLVMNEIYIKELLLLEYILRDQQTIHPYYCLYWFLINNVAHHLPINHVI